MPTPIVTPERLLIEAAKRAQQRMTEHIERFAAAYIKLTDIPPDQAVMCHEIKDGVSRIWFERKEVACG